MFYGQNLAYIGELLYSVVVSGVQQSELAVYMKVKVAESPPTLCDATHGLYSPWNSPSENTGVGSHSFPSPGDLPNPGIKPRSSTLQGIFFTSWATGEACTYTPSFLDFHPV